MQHAQKLADERDSTEVHENRMITGDFEVSRQILHSQEFLTVS
jgi:hypothetical protein